MRVAIHQPNFLPWIGYFNKISRVEKFVFLDDVQLELGKTYTQRCKILVNGQEKWITVPVIKKSETTMIRDAKVMESNIWKKKLLRTIEINYHKTCGFEELFARIKEVFSGNSPFLVDYNIPLIKTISQYLGLTTEFVRSSEMNSTSARGKGKILMIIRELQAETYLSGSGAGSARYIDPEDFSAMGVQLEYQDFYQKEYPQQRTSDFVPGLSVIDLVFNCGRESPRYIS